MTQDQEIRDAVKRLSSCSISLDNPFCVKDIHNDFNTLLDLANRYLSCSSMMPEKDLKSILISFRDKYTMIDGCNMVKLSDAILMNQKCIEACTLALIKKCEGITPEKLHEWYLEATRNIDPHNFNISAQKKYEDLTEGQKSIDKYISSAIQSYLTGRGKV